MIRDNLWVTPIFRGQWYIMPSGKTIEVCQVQINGEVVVRYMDDDATMAPDAFVVTVAMLVKHGKRVQVSLVANLENVIDQ